MIQSISTQDPPIALADYTQPTFGEKQQLPKDMHLSKKLLPKQTKRI